MAHKKEHVSTGNGYWVLNAGVRTQVIKQDGNILAPITTTDATFSGNTTFGDAVSDTSILKGRFVTGSVAGSALNITSSYLYGEGSELRYSVSDWTGRTAFNGMYLRSEAALGGAYGINGIQVYGVMNTSTTTGLSDLKSIYSETLVKASASNRTLTNATGIEANISIENQTGTLTLTNDIYCLHAKAQTGTGIADYTKVNGIKISGRDDGTARVFGTALSISDPEATVCSWTTGIDISTACTNAILVPNDSYVRIGTTRTTAETYIGFEFDETTTGIGLTTMGSLSAPMVLNTNPGATVVSDTINILHSAGSGDCVDLIGRYTKVAISGDGDSDTTLVADAPRAYVLAGVAKEVYGSQPWVSHAGTGAVTAMSALSAKLDVNTDAFTASTVNAGHFHIEGAATVTSSMFDGVMIEVYPDVTCLDSALRIVADTGAVVGNAITISGSYTNGIVSSAPISITSMSTTYTTPAFNVGKYGAGLVDTASTDNILATIVTQTATNKGGSDRSTMALYVGCSNTAATANNKLQGILASTTVAANCYDAYGIQGHVDVTANASSTSGTGNICGMSAKATVESGVTATGTVSGLLVTVDGTGTVTGTHSGVWIDNVAASDQAILISGSNKTGINLNGITISAGSATDDAGIKTAQGATAPAGSMYISTNGTVFVMVSTTWTALTIN
jgi:hypothetical protein